MKDCGVQIYINREGFLTEDFLIDKTGLSKDEAYEIFKENLPRFIDAVKEGITAEIALWVDMGDNCDYHTTEHHYHSDDCIVEHGRLYEVTKKEISI